MRSADPELVRQEVWAHLAVHHCLTRIIMRLAAQERIDPDRISFIKVLKHVRRSVIRQSAQTSVQIKQVMAMMAAKVRRKLDNGVRRLREADRFLKRPASKYSIRTAGQVRRPTRRVAVKVLTLHPAIVQLVKQRHWVTRRRCHRSTVLGVISRCIRSLAGMSRISAARTARSAQSSRGRQLARRSTATSCRSTSNSASLEADDRLSRASQPQSRTKTR